MWSLWNQRLLSTSSGHMFASHSINQGSLVTYACFTTASSKASFLGFQPSECQKIHRENTQTSSHIHRCLGDSSFVSLDRSFFRPHTRSQVAVDRHKNSPDVCLRSSVPTFSSVILAACCLSPSFLGFSVELLLHIFLPHSVLYSKEDIGLSFVYT